MNSATILNSMEHLLNSYKRIIGEAISLGVLPDINDKKLYYLNSNDSDASDCFDKEAGNLKNRNQAVKSQPSPLNATKTRHCTIPNEYSLKNAQAIDNSSIEDQLSEKTKGSIENYSILGIKNFQKMERSCNVDSDSDISSFPESVSNISSENHLVTSTIRLDAVRKKPKKNEVVDFRVPIYPCFKKKKGNIKPSNLKGKHMLCKKASIKTESSKLQDDTAKEAFREHEMNKYFLKPSSSKQGLRIPKRAKSLQLNRKVMEAKINDADDNNNDYCENCVIETNKKYKSVCELSFRKSEKTEYPLNIGAKIPIPNQCNYHEGSSVSVRKIIDLSNSTHKKEMNMQQTKQTPLNTMQVCRMRELNEGNKHISKSKTSRNSYFRKNTSTACSSKELVQNLPSQKCVCQMSKVCNHSSEMKPETTSDDLSWKESTDSETINKADEKLLNLNIICQFFPNNAPCFKQDTIKENLENIPHPEQNEENKNTLTVIFLIR
ncbi:uncharacterized protein TNIN_383101 [Trichonephila inaurata madagascariensis]|uniref:Uncharacterized protein n=1 Tax=Trichonephila inaurata madagascariensis TaxID=2747483 RepID=A0A8X6YHF5_9ARAC|nr:uncharacterized protein TNIN_383101 [Trichonephila inaurata madagascariensis]